MTEQEIDALTSKVLHQLGAIDEEDGDGIAKFPVIKAALCSAAGIEPKSASGPFGD